MLLKENKPKSQQIAEYIEQEIKSGVLKPGDRLPSVRSLASKLSVGRQIVLSAFEILSKQNILLSKVGSGTVVNPEFTFQTETAIMRIGLYCHHLDWSSINNSNVLAGVSEAGFEHNHEIITAHSKEGLDLNKWSTTHALHGMLLAGEVDDELIENATRTGIPFVVIGNYKLTEKVNAVEVDLQSLIYSATAELVKKSDIKKIAAITGPENYLSTQQIVSGVENSIKDLNLKTKLQPVYSPDEDGYSEMDKLFSSEDKPDAVLIVRQAFTGAARWLFEHMHQMKAKPVIITGSLTENDLIYRDLVDLHFMINTPELARLAVQKLEVLIADNKFNKQPMCKIIKGTYNFFTKE